MKLFKRFKIYDNEKCPCGSKKMYSECCKHKHDKLLPKNDKKPPEIKVNELFRKSLFKCCLYPDKTHCVKHIKEGHALQNNKIISKLAVNKHVYLLNHKKPPIIIPIENEEPEILTRIDRVGVNNATTYTCFCDVHDTQAFAPIENGTNGAPDFDPNNEEHKFLYAYKAFIFEYYKELVNERVFKKLIKDTPSLLKNPFYVQTYRNLIMKLNEMEEVKQFFDNGLLTKSYLGLETCVVEIPEQIKFANFACIGLDYDLHGKRIKNIKNNIMSRIFLTIFPEDNKSYVLVSYLSKDEKIYRNLINQLKSIDIGLIKYYLTLVLPLYSENIVLSPNLWENWDEETQIAFTFYNNRHGKQFAIYNKMIHFGLKNIKNKKMDFSNGNRGLIDLFPQ